MNLEEEKNISPIASENRDNKDFTLRPQRLKQFIGQTLLCNNFHTCYFLKTYWLTNI